MQALEASEDKWKILCDTDGDQGFRYFECVRADGVMVTEQMVARDSGTFQCVRAFHRDVQHERLKRMCFLPPSDLECVCVQGYGDFACSGQDPGFDCAVMTFMSDSLQ